MDTLDNPNKIIDPSTVSYQSISLRNGAIAGLILVASALIGNLTGLADPTQPNSASNWILNIVNWGIMIAFMVTAINKHRDEDLGGFITFGRAFGVSFLVALVVSVVTAIWNYVYFGFIDPEMANTLMETSMAQQGIDDDAMIDQMKFWFSPGAMAIYALIASLFFSTIISLIVAAVMKKNPPGHI
ncbi:MAG: DUF4199 domain-containing protein [Saprospiraceae bacterium]|nr:DUF4199 domain-containing protein [Saprospiraceae bacterium]